MSKFYEARRFRLRDQTTTVRDGQGSHKYDATDDADAISTARKLHAAFYDPAVDQITVWEVRPGEEDRFVHMIEGTDD